MSKKAFNLTLDKATVELARVEIVNKRSLSDLLDELLLDWLSKQPKSKKKGK